MTVIAVLTAVGWTLSVCAVDIRTLRIPPAVAAGGVAPVVTAGLAGADWTDMAAGATGSTLLYLVLRLVSPSGLGGGDLPGALAPGVERRAHYAELVAHPVDREVRLLRFDQG